MIQIIQESFRQMKNNQNTNENKKRNFRIEFSDEVAEIPYGGNFIIFSDSTNKKKWHFIKSIVKTNKYKLQFILSTTIAIIFLILLFGKLYQNNEQEKIAKDLLRNYQLTSLYSDNNQYNTNKVNSNINTPFVIGMIQIDKLQLSYPILSESNDDLLRMSLCRFTGPMPNETGNLCIVGHNYLDNRFFSRLDELSIGDIISIYGLSGQRQDYHVFKKYNVDANDLSCTNQTSNSKIVTLLTCDNLDKEKRLVIQAK